MAVHDIAMQLDVKVPIRDGGEGTVRSTIVTAGSATCRRVHSGIVAPAARARAGLDRGEYKSGYHKMGMHPLLPLPPCCVPEVLPFSVASVASFRRVQAAPAQVVYCGVALRQSVK